MQFGINNYEVLISAINHSLFIDKTNYMDKTRDCRLRIEPSSVLYVIVNL